MKKKSVVVLILLAAISVAGAGYYYVSRNLNSIIKREIETACETALNTDVVLGKIVLTPTKNSLVLTDMSIRNPDGYQEKDAIIMNFVEMIVDPTSLNGTGPIIIKRITIYNPKVTYAFSLNGTPNLTVLKDSLDEFIAAQRESAERSLQQKDDKEQLYIVKKVTVNSGIVTIMHEALHGKNLSTSFPNIWLEDIGEKEQGVTSEVIAARIYKPIVAYAAPSAERTFTKWLTLQGLPPDVMRNLGNKFLGITG